MNLNQVTLPSSDIKKSIEFYSQMGFVLIVEDDHYARFECGEGDATFSLHLSQNTIANPDFVVYFETSDLDNVVENLIKQGIKFTQQPKDETWLWREARLCDPDGNVICLYHAGENRKNPPWRL